MPIFSHYKLHFLIAGVLLFLLPFISEGQTVFINEIHYDDDGADADEGVEIAGSSGTNLAGWSVIAYNGSNGTVYSTTVLSGAVPDEGCGIGAVWFGYPSNGLQNGAPDGIALVNDLGAIIQFLSYEGSFSATNGPASGQISTDIGVSETGSTSNGFSLQLTGTGSTYTDFSWNSPSLHSRGTLNTSQSITPCGGSCSISSLAITTISCNDNGTSTDPSDDITSFDLFVDGSNVGASYSVDMDGFANISTSLAGPFITDVINGLSYGSTTTFYLEPGSAGIGSDLDALIVDSDDSNCFDIATIVDPGSCSVPPPCSATLVGLPYSGISGTAEFSHMTSNPPEPAPAEVCGDNFTLMYASTPGTDGSLNYFGTVSGNGLASEDFGGDASFQTFPIDVSGVGQVNIQTFGQTVGSEVFNGSGEEFSWWYTLDSGAEQVFFSTTSDGSLATAVNSLDVSANSTLVVGFVFNINGGGDGFENMDVTVTELIGCGHTVSEYYPLTGPAGTEVTIVGNGFTPSSSVSLGSEAATLLYQTTDTLIVEIPSSANSGNLIVDEASCLVDAGEFVVLSEDCTVGTPTLIISELCDPKNNFITDRYIEIYNPSNQPIDLTNWVLYSISNGGISDQSCTSWNLTGNIDPGQALTCGYTNPVSGGSHNFTNVNWLAQPGNQCAVDWNGQERDGAALYNGATRVDGILINLSSSDSLFKDNSLIRNSNICSSNPNSPISEWSASVVGVQNAGSGPSTPGSHSSCMLINSGDAVTISNQPNDLSEPICNEPSLSITATAGSAITYQWYFNDGSDSWTAVSNGADYSGATSATLTILDLTGKDNHQFYCETATGLSGDCKNYSNAAQLDVLPNNRLFFRSAAASGQWTNPSTWEFSVDGTNNWESACIFPLETNSDEIRISSNHTIELDAILTVPRVIIEIDATLETLINTNLTFEDQGAGAEFLVEGTWIDNGDSDNDIFFQNGASWELAPSGTIVKTNTSSTSRYRDNYETGITNIPESANWIYRREGPNNLSVVSVGMTYPYLTFENFGALYDPGNPQNFFQGGSSNTVIKGDLDIGGSGTSGYVMRNNNTNGSPILVEGDLIIRTGSTFTNDDNSIVASNEGTGIEVQGHITVDGTLDFSAETSVPRGQLVLSGSDSINFIGGGAITVKTLEINKPMRNVFSNSIITVQDSLKLTSGIIDFKDKGAGRLELGADGVIVGGSTTSYVSGLLRKTGFTLDEEFEFPVGDYRVISLDSTVNVYNPSFVTTSTTNTSVAFQSEYFHENFNSSYTNPNNPPPTDGSLEVVSTCNYWEIDKIPSNSAIEANVGLSWGGGECIDIADPLSLRVARFNTSEWDNQGLLYGFGTINSGGPDYLNGKVYTTTAFLNFSPFTIGSSGSGANVLPITLLSFRAEAKEQQVITTWITAAEINNDYFTIERSKDGNLWEKVGTVDGAGDSHTELSYSLVDDRPYSGISYYRLRQTDYDGATTLSEPRAVEIRQDGTFGIDKVYRGQEGLNLVYRATAPYVVVEIYDLLGKRIHGELLENSGNGFGTIYPDLAKGAYLLRLSHGSEFDSEKFVW